MATPDSTWMTGSVDTTGVGAGGGADLRSKTPLTDWHTDAPTAHPALAGDGVVHEPVDVTKTGHVSGADTTGPSGASDPATPYVEVLPNAHTPVDTSAVTGDVLPVSVDPEASPPAEPEAEASAPAEEPEVDEAPEPEPEPEPEGDPEAVEDIEGGEVVGEWDLLPDEDPDEI